VGEWETAQSRPLCACAVRVTTGGRSRVEALPLRKGMGCGHAHGSTTTRLSQCYQCAYIEHACVAIPLLAYTVVYFGVTVYFTSEQ
jgi:hypothetical protein